MPNPKSKPRNPPATESTVNHPPKLETLGNAHGLIASELNSVFRALDLIAERIVAELEKPVQAPVEPKNLRQRFSQFAKRRWERFVVFAKDLGPFFNGVAGICVSIMIGLVTSYIAWSNYHFNRQQAITDRLIERTEAVANFGENEKKRAVAAIQLAAFGKDAFPFIKIALRLDDEGMREGGVQTLLNIYRTQPDIRTELLDETAKYFEEKNPTLSFGVLKFYNTIATELDESQRLWFLEKLKSHFGANASSCAADSGRVVLEVVKFVAACPLNNGKQLLLDIAQYCPHEGTNVDYDGARIHAVNMLSELIEKQHLPRSERDAIVKILRDLKADASAEMTPNLDEAIAQIERSKDP